MNSDQFNRLPVRSHSGKENGKASSFSNIYPQELLESSNGLDLREFISVLIRRKKLVLTLALITVIAALVLTLLMQPIYRASTTLKIERYAPNSNIEILDGKVSRSDRDFFETQIQLLQTKTLAKRVIDQLGLQKQMVPNGIFSKIKHFFSAKQDTGKESSDAMELLFLENLTVTPINNSQLLKISYDSTSPKLAADISNAIAKTFVRQNLEGRFDTASSTKAYIADSIEITKKSLENAETRLHQYARENKIIQDVDGETTSNYSLKKQAEELITAEKERIEAEAAFNLFQKDSTKEQSAINIINDPYILSLKKAAGRLETEYQTMNPRTTKARRLRKQIDGILGQINTESKGIQSALESEFLAAKQKEDMLRVQLNKLKNNALDIQSKSTRYKTLQREVEINQLAYDKQLEQLMAVNIAGNVGANNISVIDTAGIPNKKYKPSLKTNLAFGALLGLLLGMGIAFLREYIDDSIKTSEGLERITGLPVLSQLPEINGQNAKQIALHTATEPKSSLAESIRSLRTSLRFSTRSGSPRSIFITSTAEAEGKSTVALNLATAYAQTGNSVLLIDADLRNPGIHNLLGIENLKGLTNFLAGSEENTDISRACLIKNLRVITSGPIPPDPVELLSGNKMIDLLEISAGSFDHIIIDGPPVLGLADALVLSNLSDATIITVQAGKTHKAAILDSLKRLELANANIVGSILTRVSRDVNPDYNQKYYSYSKESSTDKNRKARVRTL